MKSEQKNKRRGRSPSPKRKLKRKYRNDRSKKAHQSSSESSTTEEASLTSDEYPSSGEERRKEAKKKRLKKTKVKSRASASSSRSPSPDKVKKKPKPKEDGDGKKDKYRKDRKYSPSPKKKRRRSSDSGGSSDDSRERSPSKREKSKKKHSPSPVKIKKKISVSPIPGKASVRIEKKKKSVSPIRSRRKTSPSPPSKDKRSRSPTPVKNKKNKSPTRPKKKSVSPSPPRSKKRSVSPLPGKHKAKSRSPPSRSRKRSTTPPPMKEKKITTNSAVKSKSPITSRPKKKNQSPAPVLKSPTTITSAPKKESKGSAPRVESKSPLSNNVEKKMKIHGPVLPALPPSLRSPSPLSPTLKSTSLNKIKNDTGEGSKRSSSPIGEVKKKNAFAMEDAKKKSVSPTEEVKKKFVTPISGKEIDKKYLPISAKELEKKVIATKSAREVEKKIVAPLSAKDVEKKVVVPLSAKEVQKKVIAPISAKEVEKNVMAPLSAKDVEKKIVAPIPGKEVEENIVAPLYSKDVEKKVVAPIPTKEVEKQQSVGPVIVKADIKVTNANEVKNVTTSSQSTTISDVSIPLIGNVTTHINSPMELKQKASPISNKVSSLSASATSSEKKFKIASSFVKIEPNEHASINTVGISSEKDIKISSPLVKNEPIENPVPNATTITTTNVSNKLSTVRETSNLKIKSPLVIKKKITIVSALNVMSVKKEPVVTPARLLQKDESHEDTKMSVNSPIKVKKSSSPVFSRSRKRSSSPVRNRKKSRSVSPIRTRKRSKSPSPRIRKRSKSPRRERKRSRSRSPARYRRDEKQRRRSRSRSASPSRIKRDRDRSPDKDSKKRKEGDVKRKGDRKDDDRSSEKKDKDDKDRRRNRDDKDKDRRKKDEKDVKGSKRDKSPEKKDITELEEEMKKRKERIEAWRNANRKKGEGEDAGEEDTSGDAEKKKAEKKWSLEDDDSEDEEQGDESNQKEGSSKKNAGKATSSKKDVKKKIREVKGHADDDPLDSFMKSIDAEVNTNSGRNNAMPTSTAGSKTKTITVLKTVTVNKPEEVKPEVMEQNQDALEYSSEEEATADIKASDFTDATKKRKELTVADHTKIYYAPFRKNFYVEVPELARMSADEVKLLRETLGDIQVRGKTIPKPIKTWAQAGLSSKVMNVLKRCEYEKPTPVQAQALPVAMSGRDMIGIAKTGSGKTLAFVLPMLRHVLDQPALDEDDGPIAIIMTPTRELALQIYRESKKFCKVLNLTVTCIYGGSGISEQISELKKGTEIIVCTPGRMIDMLAANNGRVTNCRRCTYLVMDEADRMFDMGFEPQVMRIIGNIRPERQTVLFSATFPRQMEAVARKVLTKPIEIQVGGRSIVCSDVEQHAIVIEEDNKFFKVLELLGVYQEIGSILLFVERQETADMLFKDLLKKGYPCLSLHGGMDQFDRDSTIADFKNSVTKLMVSTSVAARGLDVKNLNLVVNYDCPNHYEDYVHRVGRTGRAGNKGTAFTFVTPEQGRNSGDIIKAFDLSKCEPPEDVFALWSAFKEDMEKEGKTIKMNSGFSGTKGFKFNAEEDAMVNESKKMRKFTLGLQDSDEEAEAADDAMEKIEADLEKAFSSKPKVALQPEIAEGQKMKIAEQNVDKDKLKQASNIAALINKKLSSGQVIDRNTAATAHIMQGGALESLTGVGLAKQLADKVNAKLNYKAAEVESQAEEKPIAVRYEEEIDINDFPQQARWRITSKEIIEQVRELSEAGVTVRGLYIPPNKKPTEEERRLHLYIESLSERSIQIAKAEIKRLLKDELLKSESNSYRPTQQTGRYKVL